jgi:hypothetical protein
VGYVHYHHISKRLLADSLDGLRTIYRAEGTRGLYKGSLLALVGVSNGSIQFAPYEEIKRKRMDIKRKLFASQGKEWKVEDEKLVSAHGPCLPLAHTSLSPRSSRSIHTGLR